MTDLIKHIRDGGKVQTRDGRAVTIYTTEARGFDPIHGAIGGTTVMSWSDCGRAIPQREGELDLIPVPAKPKRWETWVKVRGAEDHCVCEEAYTSPPAPVEYTHVREVLPDDIDPDAARDLVAAVERYMGISAADIDENEAALMEMHNALAKATGEA